MNSTNAGLRMYVGEIKLNLELDGRSWSKVQKFDESERDTCHHMDQRDPPGSFLAKGGGQWWDPLVGWSYLSAD